MRRLHPHFASPERRYWRSNLLMMSPNAGDAGLSLAQAGRETESIPFLWAELIEQEKDVPASWLNLAVALNKARSLVASDEQRFAEISAISLACFQRAELLYRQDATPLDSDGLPPAIAENGEVILHLRQTLDDDAQRAAHEAAATAVISRSSPRRMPLHAVARRCMPLHVVTGRYRPLHARLAGKAAAAPRRAVAARPPRRSPRV